MERQKKKCNLLIIFLMILTGILIVSVLKGNQFFERLKKSADITKSWEMKESKSLEKDQYERGYDLPVDEKEELQAKKDCKEMMKRIQSIYEKCEKGNALNVVISEETTEKMLETLKEVEQPVISNICYGNMYHYEVMEDFLKKSMKGKEGEVVVYEVRTDGGIGRKKYIFDGTDMYLLYIGGSWNDKEKPVISSVSFSRILRWNYTKKGWFCYELCVPEPPEVSEVVDGNCMLRIKPVKEKYLEIMKNYLLPLGYQGNNLLRSNWDKDHLDELDYAGLYEAFYRITYQREPDSEKCKQGIPKEDFENIMEQYLPVTMKQLQKFAAFDSKDKTYAWDSQRCVNYAPNAFGASVPEIVGLEKNEDGTVALTIDAVCESMGEDTVIRHILTVRFLENGGIKYLSNQILGDGMKKIPAYQYRIPRIIEN